MIKPVPLCVVSTSRADFGLLRPLMRAIKSDPDLRLQVVVTGMHLSVEHGFTAHLVEEEFGIDERVEMLLSSDTESAATIAIGLGCVGFAAALKRLNPRLVVVLGDRFELMSPVIAAVMARIPVAHIHGGETTEGAIDERIRHAVTKLASLHFTSTEEYRRRVIQMGEEPWRVFAVGAPGLDNLEHLDLPAKNLLEQRWQIRFHSPIALVTYHPETLVGDATIAESGEMLAAIAQSGIAALFTGSNADPRGRTINQNIRAFCAEQPEKYQFVENLGSEAYLSCLRLVDLMIGNSSSGIIEAPSFQLPVVNIGNRQKGRIRGRNVIDTSAARDDIKRGIVTACSHEFKSSLTGMGNPYAPAGIGNISMTIKEHLKDLVENPRLLGKPFHDLLPGNS